MARARRRQARQATPLELLHIAENELIAADRESALLETYTVGRVFDYQEARMRRPIARFYRWLARGACKVNVCSCMTKRIDDRLPEGYHLNAKEYLWWAKTEARMAWREAHDLYEKRSDEFRNSETYVILETA